MLRKKVGKESDMKELKQGQKVRLSWKGTRGARVEKRGVITGIYPNFVAVRTGHYQECFLLADIQSGRVTVAHQ